MGQRAVLQIGVDLLNDGVVAVGLVGRDGIQSFGVQGREERVMPVRPTGRAFPARRRFSGSTPGSGARPAGR